MSYCRSRRMPNAPLSRLARKCRETRTSFFPGRHPPGRARHRPAGVCAADRPRPACRVVPGRDPACPGTVRHRGRMDVRIGVL